MARRRGKKKRKQKEAWPRGFPVGRQPVPVSVARALDQAAELLEADRPDQALALLEPLRETAPYVEEVWAMLGDAYALQKRFWDAALAYRRALKIAPRDLEVQLVLMHTYLNLELWALSWNLLRKVRREAPALPALPEALDLGRLETMLDAELTAMTQMLGRPRTQVEQGLYYLEEGQIMLHIGDYERAARLNRRAVRLLPRFPAPANNLALALFFLGRREEAIEVEREVLAYDPENIQALGNLIRFHRWAGEEDQAQALWQRLKALRPAERTLLLKQVEAAAIMEDDESVHRLLQKVRRLREAAPPLPTWPWEYYLAVAEANLGRRRTALRRLAPLREQFPRARRLWQALQAGQKSLGFTGRFHYVAWYEVLPQEALDIMHALAERDDEEDIPPKEQRKLRQMAARYPQVALALRKLLWEEGEVAQAVSFAAFFDAPETYRVLEEFALGQAGDDQVRLEVLFALQRAEYYPLGKTVRFWQNGAWIEIQLRAVNIQERELPVSYGEQVIRWQQEAILAQREGRLEEARSLYHRILEVNPQVKEAYHNLAVMALQEGKEEEGEALLRQALAIDPDYLLARLHLALLALKRGDPAPAQELAPLMAQRTDFTLEEMKTWSYLQARLAMWEGRTDEALRHIEMALELDPEDEGLQDLARHLVLTQLLEEAQESALENLKKRRLRRRARLGTRHPTLAQALALYTRERLGAIGRLLDPEAKWYTLRKAERVQRVRDLLQRPEVLARLVADLDPEERRALRRVLAAGGALDWDTFAQEFDHDWEELEDWEYIRPKSVMGRLRSRGLLVESEAKGRVWLSIPVELREPLEGLLATNEAPEKDGEA